MPRNAIFLDRDGVINSYVYNAEFGTVDSPSTPAEFVLCGGVGEAIAELNRLGLLVIVVSNQPGIAKGKFTASLLSQVTAKMHAGIAENGGKLDAVYYCLHHPNAELELYRIHCDCRKPRPGMLLRAAREWDIDLKSAFMIGDGLTDIAAGLAAGAHTIFIGQSKPYIVEAFEKNGIQPEFMAVDLMAAVGIVKQQLPAAIESRTGDSRMTYTEQYLAEAIEILKGLDCDAIERMVDLLVAARGRGGRLFILGVGGGAGHASHAVCDFRKIGGIEAYTPSDNVSELTARTNDDGWETTYANWLLGSRIGPKDVVLVFSVGGGDLQRNISANLVRALQCAKQAGAKISGIVGRDGGFTAQVADVCALVRVANPATVTPHTEAFQALIWHLLVSHPRLKASEMKWESVR